MSTSRATAPDDCAGEPVGVGGRAGRQKMPVNWVPRNGARCRNCRVDVAAGPLLPELMMARGLQNVSQPEMSCCGRRNIGWSVGRRFVERQNTCGLRRSSGSDFAAALANLGHSDKAVVVPEARASADTRRAAETDGTGRQTSDTSSARRSQSAQRGRSARRASKRSSEAVPSGSTGPSATVLAVLGIAPPPSPLGVAAFGHGRSGTGLDRPSAPCSVGGRDERATTSSAEAGDVLLVGDALAMVQSSQELSEGGSPPEGASLGSGGVEPGCDAVGDVANGAVLDGMTGGEALRPGPVDGSTDAAGAVASADAGAQPLSMPSVGTGSDHDHKGERSSQEDGRAAGDNSRVGTQQVSTGSDVDPQSDPAPAFVTCPGMVPVESAADTSRSGTSNAGSRGSEASDAQSAVEMPDASVPQREGGTARDLSVRLAFPNLGTVEIQIGRAEGEGSPIRIAAVRQDTLTALISDQDQLASVLKENGFDAKGAVELALMEPGCQASVGDLPNRDTSDRRRNERNRPDGAGRIASGLDMVASGRPPSRSASGSVDMTA